MVLFQLPRKEKQIKQEESKEQIKNNAEVNLDSLSLSLSSIPALGNIVDLAFDRHEKGLFGIGTVILLKLLFCDFPELNRRRKRL